jgi:ClpP class serine protease
MATWNETVEEIFAFEDAYNDTINLIDDRCKLIKAELEKEYGDAAQIIRLKYIRALEKHTGRNVITYYSGWLQKHDPYTEIEDNDVSGFVDAIHELDTNIGLDIIIHTPGGDDNVVEAIVNNLRATFGTDIRAIIPQLAMSSGTLLVLACDKVMMGKHSSIGPIDPQYIYTNGDAIAAQDVIDAYKEAQPNDKVNVPLLRLTFEKYEPAFIKRCETI